MGALDNLLAGKPQASGSKPASSAIPLAPKVQSAKGALATQTAKVKANFKSQAVKNKSGGGRLDSLLKKTQRVQEGGNANDGFDFSFNPIKLVGEIAQNVPAVGTALELADTPRAAVTSAVKELAIDPITGQGGPSLKDFVSQLRMGHHVGFGQLEQQANPNQNDWVKRLIGFAGDVAADPLTYVGVGIAKDAGTIAKGLATADRVELAKGIASQAAKGVEGATDEAIASVGRKGLAGLSAEQRAQLGLRPTLTAGGVPIAGTEGLALGVRKVTGKIKEVAGDTLLGRAARRVATKESERKLVEDVVSGGAHAAESAKALESVHQMNAIARQFGATHGKDLQSILKSMSREELRKLPSELEAGGELGWRSPAAQKVGAWLENVRTEANKNGANLAKIEDYYPHALTPDAAEAMAKEGVIKGRAPGGAVTPELLRKYKAGDKFMGVKLANGSADEINSIYKETFKHDLFSTKAEEVLPHYLQAVQSAVARGSYANRLVEHGVGRKIASEADRFSKTPTPALDFGALDASGVGPLAAAPEKAAMTPAYHPVWDQTAAIADPAPLAQSVDRTAMAADLQAKAAPSGYAGLYTGTAAPTEHVANAKSLMETATTTADPQIKVNATLAASAENAEAQLKLTGDVLTQEEMDHFVHTPQAPIVMSKLVEKGFQQIAPGVAAPQWLAEARQVERALTPEGWKAFLGVYDRFTQMWKAAATFSPGFHVRNAYSGVFNNFVAGVDAKLYAVYQKLFHQAEKGTLSEADRVVWDYVQKGVEATGNPFDPAEIGKAGTAQVHHKILRYPANKSRSWGNYVENHLRGVMALDSYRRGEELTTAISRIQRFHFNYADISNFDRVAKRIIPFWMFTSRNLPLQMQMIIRRPGAYTKFLSLQRNLSLGTTPDQVVPSYFGEQGAIQTDLPLPGSEGTKYLALDLPFLRVNKDLEQLAEPVRLLSNANPLIKAPVEAIAGKRLYNNVPFRNELQDVPWYMDLPVIKQALIGLGVEKQGADGKAKATDQSLNTLESLLPLAGRARRLAPSEDAYQQRFGTSLASFLGLTSLTNTPSAQLGELARRKRALEEFVKQQQQLGYYPKAKSNAPKQKPFG